jgi:hypothetical protein
MRSFALLGEEAGYRFEKGRQKAMRENAPRVNMGGA